MTMTQRAPQPPSPWLTREEAADFLRCAPNTIDNLVRRGVIHRYKVRGLASGQNRYSRKEIAGIVIFDHKVSPDEMRDAADAADLEM